MTMEDKDRDGATSRAPVLRILVVFARLGMSAFGGPAMVAYIRDAVVVKSRWVSEDSFEDGVALCQSIPGPTVMHTAAYCGFRAGGSMGAIAAYAGFALPSFLLITALAAVYDRVQDSPLATSLFTGLRVVTVAIVAHATVDFAWASLKTLRDVLLASAITAFLGMGGNPVVVITGVAAIALILYRHAIQDLPPHPGAQDASAGKHGKPLILPVAVGLATLLVMVFLFFVSSRLFGLAWVMMKVDLFAFGGGYSTIPLLLHELVDMKGWLDSETFLDAVALSQVTPGPVIKVVAFMGYHVAGLWGAVVAMAGIVTPTFIVLLVCIPYLDRLQESALFRRALRGALVCFVGLLVSVAVRFAAEVSWSIPAVLLACAAFLALRSRIDILWVALGGACMSAVMF